VDVSNLIKPVAFHEGANENCGAVGWLRQCGLANLDRCSRVGQTLKFVSWFQELSAWLRDTNDANEQPFDCSFVGFIMFHFHVSGFQFSFWDILGLASTVLSASWNLRLFVSMPISKCSGQYMVGGGGFKQHVNYNISCNMVAVLHSIASVEANWMSLALGVFSRRFLSRCFLAAKRGMNGGPLGEALKLTLGCLKEGFNFYQHLGYDFLAETQLSQFVCNLLTELAFVAPFFKVLLVPQQQNWP